MNNQNQMTGEELEKIGKEIWGYGWQTKLAMRLGKNVSTIRRWLMIEVPTSEVIAIRSIYNDMMAVNFISDNIRSKSSDTKNKSDQNKFQNSINANHKRALELLALVQLIVANGSKTQNQIISWIKTQPDQTIEITVGIANKGVFKILENENYNGIEQIENLLKDLIQPNRLEFDRKL